MTPNLPIHEAAAATCIWTTDHVNIDESIQAANAACRVVHPLVLVQSLIESTSMRVVQGDCVHVDNNRLSFPMPLALPLSLPVFMFHALIFERRSNVLNNNQSAFMAWDRRVELQSIYPRTDGQDAIIKVARYFDDLYGVHPLLAQALSTGHSRLSSVVAVCARALRRCLFTASAIDHAICGVVRATWHVSTSTRFFSHLNDTLYGACIVWRAVKYDPISKQACGTVATVPLVIDHSVGLVVTPMDKTLIVALLLFTEQFTLFSVFRGVDETGMRDYGVPAPLISFIITCRQIHCKAPEYYGRATTPEISEWETH